MDAVLDELLNTSNPRVFLHILGQVFCNACTKGRMDGRQFYQPGSLRICNKCKFEGAAPSTDASADSKIADISTSRRWSEVEGAQAPTIMSSVVVEQKTAVLPPSVGGSGGHVGHGTISSSSPSRSSNSTAHAIPQAVSSSHTSTKPATKVNRRIEKQKMRASQAKEQFQRLSVPFMFTTDALQKIRLASSIIAALSMEIGYTYAEPLRSAVPGKYVDDAYFTLFGDD